MRVRSWINSSSSSVGSIHQNPSAGQPLELLCYFLQGSVDVELWSLTEGLLAERTLVDLSPPTSSTPSPPSIPVGGDAGLAETVATWCGDWVVEDVQTDGAGELVFRQEGSW